MEQQKTFTVDEIIEVINRFIIKNNNSPNYEEFKSYANEFLLCIIAEFEKEVE